MCIALGLSQKQLIDDFSSQARHSFAFISHDYEERLAAHALVKNFLALTQQSQLTAGLVYRLAGVFFLFRSFTSAGFSLSPACAVARGGGVLLHSYSDIA